MKILQRSIRFTACALLLYITVAGDPAKAQPQVNFSKLNLDFSIITDIKHAGDNSGRLFVVEQAGRIKIVKNGALLTKPFLNISTIVGKGSYQGIWGMAFSPDYANDRTFFIMYSDASGNTFLERYKTSATDANVAEMSSAKKLISITSEEGRGPHYGRLQFGRDGYLYVMISNISYPGRKNTFAQDGKSLAGKVLRLNVTNVKTAPFYTIPAGNPFVNDPAIADEIWAFGIRNAWGFSFDRRNGNMWLADVGELKREELNMESFGSGGGNNYGWPCYEADLVFEATGCKAMNNYVFPEFSYKHNVADGGVSIIGGYVYRGSDYPALQGYYICADYQSRNLWKIKYNSNGKLVTYIQGGAPVNISTFGEDENGELYVATTEGKIYKLTSTTAAFAALH